LKKKKIKLKIENEFKFCKDDHMIRTIRTAFRLYKTKDLNTKRLAYEVERIKWKDCPKKNKIIVDGIYNRDENMLKLYEYCWKQLNVRMIETKVWTGSIYELIRKEFTLE
jgi:hypothetical protein